MLGAIIGDIVGSRFEFNNTNRTDFDLFTGESSYTDDTICTVAIADAILNGKSYKDSLLEWCRKYPNPKGAYGGSFAHWIHSADPQPYNSYGNGSAMRVSPVSWLFDDLNTVLSEAKKSAEVTHSHSEGIKGAQVIANLIYRYRKGTAHPDNPCAITGISVDSGLYYDIPTLSDIKANNSFNETCQITVPQSLRCFLESDNFEMCIRLAISIGGDSDTIGAIAGSLAEARFGIPPALACEAIQRLPYDMKTIVEQFYDTINYGNRLE